MVRALFLILNAALLFCIFSGPSSLPFSEVKPAYAQAGQPSPAAPPLITYQGGSGDSLETAVIISGAPNSQLGIAAEYQALEKRFGRRDVDWKLKRQSVQHHKGKVYDIMELELKGGSTKTIFFEITEFFGKN